MQFVGVVFPIFVNIKYDQITDIDICKISPRNNKPTYSWII